MPKKPKTLTARGKNLREAAADIDEVLVARMVTVLQQPRLQREHERNVAGHDAEVSFNTRRDDRPHLFLDDRFVGRHHG